jgi:aryl-phospho-beta-D-glucosidase BglC (GH1 family)
MHDPLFQPPLRTSGRYIIDAAGRRFKLLSVNWYGGSDELFVPGGLEVRPRADIARLIRSMGFNSVRLPYSDEMVVSNPLVAPAQLAANPDLVGMRAVDVFSAVVTACTDAGLAVIVNDHITQAGWCDGRNLCDSGWSNSHLGPLCRVRQTEDQWLDNWETIMRRFVHNPRVVGVDLRNEPRGVWGTQNWKPWAKAATRAGERLLALNRDWLIIVEGIKSANDLSGAKKQPVTLSVPNRVVYSVHVFAWSGWAHLSPYSSRPYPGFVLAMMRNWAWLLKDNIAPVWISEMGASREPGKGDQHYWGNLMKYLETVDADFGYWAINPRKPHENEQEYWALVEDDWETVVDDFRLQGMRKLMSIDNAKASDCI